MRNGGQGDLRSHLLELMECMGVRIQKAMAPHTITHVVAADLDGDSSQKIAIAREFQCVLPGHRMSQLQDPCWFVRAENNVHLSDKRALLLCACCRARRQIWLVNCLWIYNSLRHWQAQPAGALQLQGSLMAAACRACILRPINISPHPHTDISLQVVQAVMCEDVHTQTSTWPICRPT